MAHASEQKLCPSRTTAWDACTSQAQRGQAQGAAGAITTNQLTVVLAEKDDPRTNTPFPHTIYAEILTTILTPGKTPDQHHGSLNQSKVWAIKMTKPENKHRQNQIIQHCTLKQQDQVISRQAKRKNRKELNKPLQAGIKRYALAAQRMSNRFSRLSK